MARLGELRGPAEPAPLGVEPASRAVRRGRQHAVPEAAAARPCRPAGQGRSRTGRRRPAGLQPRPGRPAAAARPG